VHWLTLRPATAADAPLLREWRNEPATRAASRNTGEVGEAEHVAWLESAMADPDWRLFVAERDERPVGQVRFYRSGDTWEISVSLAPELRGGGLGAAVIDAGVERLRADGAEGTVEAWVRTGNQPSLRAFENGGFVERPERASPEFRVLTLTL
jgi:RimJ/RimL family protein N-acetyltransferase